MKQWADSDLHRRLCGAAGLSSLIRSRPYDNMTNINVSLAGDYNEITMKLHLNNVLEPLTSTQCIICLYFALYVFKPGDPNSWSGG